MLSEFIGKDRIVPGLAGNMEGVTHALIERLPEDLRAQAAEKSLSTNPFHYDGVAIPHFRSSSVASPEVVLGFAPAGIDMPQGKVRIILLLVLPAEDAGIAFLQGMCSLLPAIQDRAANSSDPEEILRIIKSEEENPAHSSYINLQSDQVAFELQTDLAAGLSSEEAQRRLTEFGANTLRTVRRTPWYIRLVGNFFSFFAILLWLAALLCFVPGVDMPQLGIAILIVVTLNGIFSFLQEYKSDRAVEALSRLISRTCRVLRNGEITEAPTAELVPGDIITLDEGDIVPADARLIEAFEVEVDNSALTGESNSVRRYKTEQRIILPGKFLWIEMPNILFAGSALIRGSARAIVFGTGMTSEIGKIARLTQEIKKEESPLQKQLKGTVYAIALLAFTLGAAFLALGWVFGGLSFLQAFVFFIGLFVANVPEGLLPTVTLSLAMGVSRMAKRNALVKNLSSVETLGCTTVICCDKTGTLTQNLMMVTQIYADGKTISVDGIGYEPMGSFHSESGPISSDELSRKPVLTGLFSCAYNCNNARIEKHANAYRVLGDPTEGALVALANRAGVRGTHSRLHLNPFESVRKRMSVVVRRDGDIRKTVYAKGAPMEMLERCKLIQEGNNTRLLTEGDRAAIKEKNDEFASSGLRVLALAFRNDDGIRDISEYNAENCETDLVFLGLAAMSDPIRPQVPGAIEICHAAGIRVIMITGDYALTAQSIGKRIGLGSGAAGGNLPVFAGVDIAQMTDESLAEILKAGETVFARVSPDQKLRIVTLLRNLGEIVAVTGDGVNDGPALKRADIGIAMGLRGTDVAKEASQIILTDDNFASIAAAIEEGRGIFENIKRFAAYVLSSNPQEMYPYILWMLFPGTPLAMTVMGVLAVDVGTDLIPAMGLGIEPPEKGIMEKPPRKKGEKLLSVGFILQNYFVQGSILAFACFATYFYFGWALGVFSGGVSLSHLPSSPAGLDMKLASFVYLQSLTAYFFPTVATQIGNVMCRR
ncbi:MAG TPA: HAD-IC family P-type ATPase, partial [Leptospiraceae bacterium]|nr:HAD-IC family P-type ATPase [Leptospiraceae bacterium]